MSIKHTGQRVIFAQELFETFLEIKNRNITMTRLYILLIVITLIMYSLTFLFALFFREFLLSSMGFCFTILFYFLLINRKRKFIAKYLDWFGFLGNSLCLLVVVFHNMYNYSLIANSQIYIILVVDLLYLVFINSTKQRIVTASIAFGILLILFILCVCADYFFWHKNLVISDKFDYLHILVVFITIASCVFSAYIVGLKSIQDVNQFANFTSSSQNLKKTGNAVFNKKDIFQGGYYLLKNSYENLNICIFDFSIFLKDKKQFFKADNKLYEKTMEKFIGLLKIYGFLNEILILRDINAFVLISEDEEKVFFNSLSSINENFNKLIKNKEKKYEINLKIIAKHYKNISTEGNSRFLLDKVNEVVKLEYETQNIGKEYFIYEVEAKQNKLGKFYD